MNEIEKIEYRIRELQTRLAAEPKRDVLNIVDYSKGYLAALQDILGLLKNPETVN